MTLLHAWGTSISDADLEEALVSMLKVHITSTAAIISFPAIS
jgi:hypothetical protein